MKSTLLYPILLVTILFTFNSCSSDATETTVDAKLKITVEYKYIPSELETMRLINDYRKSVGLGALEMINYISVQSEGHNYYMIANNVINHDGFADRSNNIITRLRATKVGENIAYNYSTPQAAVKAWLNSPSHKENIVGKYTHFGIAIRENPTTGNKYYTNIFAKI
jgi:uncharacterized protein YkwD